MLFHVQLSISLLLLAAALTGCRPGGDAPGPLAVVISGDTAGWIVPCGCTSNQSGGLPRRATLIGALRDKTEVVVLDAGGTPGGRSLYDRLKYEAMLRGQQAMGAAALNLGAAEIALGPDAIREIAERTGSPLVSANTSTADGRPLAEPLRIIKAAGRRLAVVGVVGPRYATAQVRVAPPREAVLTALGGAKGRYDAVIVLAYLPEDELKQLAETLPEADVVAGGPTGQSMPPRRIGPALLVSATRQGKFVARLSAPRPGAAARWSGEIVELTDRFADDTEQLAGVDHFRQELAQQDLAPADTSFAPSLPDNVPAGFAVAGTAKCRECHAEQWRVWEKSGHARAWQSLEKKGAHVDPACQRCHTTGYGLPGGFVSARRSAERVQVGCESCHGPCREHAAEPKAHTPHFAMAASQCTACHDHENSPTFDSEPYWQKIRHGKNP